MNKLDYKTSRTTIFMDAAKKEALQRKIAKRNRDRSENDPKTTLTSVFEAAADGFMER